MKLSTFGLGITRFRLRHQSGRTPNHRVSTEGASPDQRRPTTGTISYHPLNTVFMYFIYLFHSCHLLHSVCLQVSLFPSNCFDFPSGRVLSLLMTFTIFSTYEFAAVCQFRGSFLIDSKNSQSNFLSRFY